MKAMRLMVMGGPAVGKTSLIRRLRDEGNNHFLMRHIYNFVLLLIFFS